MNGSTIFRTTFSLFLLLISFTVLAQEKFQTSEGLFYEKKELNSGLRLGANSEREELLTDESRKYEEATTGEANFQFSNRRWKYIDYMQQEFLFNFEIGPFGGFGNCIDSSGVENRTADHNLFGIRSTLSVDYTNRYYYNKKSYTLVQIDGRARYDWYKQNSTGTAIDSNDVVTNFDESSAETKFRYAIKAKAGWGLGRLEPMNNFMLADYILGKYYAGRMFSETEIKKLAAEIYTIKNQRNLIAGHNNEIEEQQIISFLNEKMLLTVPVNLLPDWKMAEFLPRFNGDRVEGGPFFNYFNREPDFVYGGYIQYDNAKYCNQKWNRNFSANISYNGYKRDDWVSAEINLGWSFFPDLKQQFDFGVKYIPGVTIKNSTNSGEFNHGVVPYIGYFSQLNSKSRVEFTFAYRISEDEKLMFPGPEFSLSFYRSRY